MAKGRNEKKEADPKAGLPGTAGAAGYATFLRRRREAPKMPTRPVASSVRLAGSGATDTPPLSCWSRLLGLIDRLWMLTEIPEPSTGRYSVSPNPKSTDAPPVAEFTT